MIYFADKNGRTDSVYHTLITKLTCNIPIVLVSWVEDFVFNDALLDIKDYTLICFCEYGYDFEIKDSHIWGKGTAPERYRSEQWDKFDTWVKNNPFKVVLKRELLAKDVTESIKPIEYPCLVNSFGEHSEVEFNNRPINVFQYWGRSNEHRLRIHSEIWLHGYTKGFQPCDNLYFLTGYMEHESGEKWVTLWMPHYYRIDVNELLKVNNLSKLSLSWAGSGFKCFRTAEAPVNSVMVMHKNNYAWSFEWNETNCVLVDNFKEIEQIEETLLRTDLYEVYKKGVENSKNYRVENYIPFIENIINNA